jgi:hypothetical protein
VVKAGAPVIRKYAGRNKGFSVPYPSQARDSRSCDPAETWIGPGKDTEASAHIVDVVDKEDPRPVWIVVWGGAMDLAQALWRVREERTPRQQRAFIAKLRVYQISWQDTGAVWIWENFPKLFLIQNSTALRGIYSEGPDTMRDKAWVDANIRRDHGPLGAGYPDANVPGIKEGDTPSFLHLLSIGLSDPEHPEWGGWGGRFRKLDAEHTFYVDARDLHPGSRDAARESRWTVGRWNEATSNDFAARMDWCVRDFAAANHHPVVLVDEDSSRTILRRQVAAGATLTLSAAGTYDPDDDSLQYRWWPYVEAGSYDGHIELHGAESITVSVVAPDVEQREQIHLILEVTDKGHPPLTSYRRLVITIRQ